MTKTLVGTPDPSDEQAAAEYLEFLEEQFKRANGADLFAEERIAHAEEIVKLYQVIGDLRELVSVQRLLINILAEAEDEKANDSDA